MYAAATSPRNRHRSVVMGVGVAAAIRASTASVPGGSAPLPRVGELAKRAATAYGISEAFEDFVPPDPTRVALLRVGSETLRAVPGLTERPVADLTRALRIADAVDSRLVRRFRFGIANVANVLMRYGDFCVRHLASSWVPAPDVDFDEDISVPEVEHEATRAFLRLDPLTHIELDDADRLALEWLTTSPRQASYRAESLSSPFGRFIRFADSANDHRWVPPVYIPEILGHAVQELVAALDRDNRARRALRRSCLNQIRQALWRFSNELIESPPARERADQPLRGLEVEWLVPVNRSTFIAVSAIYADDLGASEPPYIGAVELAKRVKSQSAPAEFRMAGGRKGRIRPGAEVVPLIVVAAPGHLAVPQSAGEAHLALEDLTWIAETATSDDDLYSFAKDLSAPDFPASFGWEAINYWEAWRANGKSFFKGGVIPSHFYFEAHAGAAEWERAVELSRLEESLLKVGLPPLRNTRAAEVAPGAVANVALFEGDSHYDSDHGLSIAPELAGWSLALTDPPVAVARTGSLEISSEHQRFFFDLCGGLVYGFAALDRSWHSAHRTVDAPGYLLRLEPTAALPEHPGRSVKSVWNPRRHGANEPVDVTWHIDVEGFANTANGDPTAANRLTSDAVFDLLSAGGVASEAAEAVRDEWRSGKPFLILEMKRARTTLNHLPRPWGLRLSDEATMTATLGRRIHQTGIEPGRYRGDAASTLVREQLAPTALGVVIERIRAHDLRQVVTAGMEQLARVMDNATRQQDDLSRVSANLSTTWDPLSRTAELSAETLRLRQCNEIIVEAALRARGESPGSRPITPQSWSELLVAADAYLTATTLSERMHHQVLPPVIDVSSMYELNVEDDPQPEPAAWVVRNDELNLAAAGIRLNGPGDEESLQQANSEDGVEAAFRRAWGASSEDMLITLAALAQWESFKPGRSTAHLTVAEATSWVCEAIGEDVDESRRACVEAAIQMLTSTAENMGATDWKPWQTRTRRHRLLVQPLVQDSDGRLIVSPQYLLTSFQVFYRHLSQGVLPWAGDVPQIVTDALADRRSRRNIRFEQYLQDRLKDLGYTTVARVKPGDHARLGVPVLTTEVDLVCGRPGDSNLWLVEAKDPASVHGFAESARQLRSFFRDQVGSRGTKPCYATQLARKEGELRPHVETIAARLGLGDPPEGESFRLHTLFVTRNLTPASFVNERYPVVTAADFLADRGRGA